MNSREIAREFMRTHDLQDPLDLHEVARLANATIHRNVLATKMMGKTLPLQNGTFAIMVNSTASEERQDFAIAHELGHIIVEGKPGLALWEEQTGHVRPEDIAAHDFAKELLGCSVIPF